MTVTRVVVGWFVVLAGAAAAGAAEVAGGDPPEWRDREEVTIAVTDSGLGGLAVVADLEHRLRAAGAFRSARIVFFNALFSNQSGYNSLPERTAKIEHFDRALASLARRFEPDLVLVACNTLSVLLPSTAFVARGNIPVRGIVEPGVALIAEALRAAPRGRVILFGTRTTVEEDSHRAALAAAGLASERVITQICPELASTIERGFDSEDTELLIATFVDEAVERLGEVGGPVFASLNCSHYPYAGSLWKAALEQYELGEVAVLDPNRAMLDLLFRPPLAARFEDTEITVTVVSKVEISEDRRASIGRAVEAISPRTARALGAYEWLPDLF